MDRFSVLVIDDEVDFVDTLVKRLKRQGVEARGAYSGREALELIGDQACDVVLLDMKLADEDGNDVLREIKDLYPEIQVVILSGQASARDGREGLTGGACDYLLKPVEFESLLEKLQLAHSRGSRLA